MDFDSWPDADSFERLILIQCSAMYRTAYDKMAARFLPGQGVP